MLKTTLTIMLISLALLLTGCQTLNNDREQNIRHYSRIADLNRRMFNEDIETFFLLDRPSRLTDVHIPSH